MYEHFNITGNFNSLPKQQIGVQQQAGVISVFENFYYRVN